MISDFNYVFQNGKIIIFLVMDEYVYTYVFRFLWRLNCGFFWVYQFCWLVYGVNQVKIVFFCGLVRFIQRKILFFGCSLYF